MVSKLDYDIAFSGSSGNAVRIENVLFDIGRKYDDIAYMLPDVKAIFISHKHSDHLSVATYKKIVLHYPMMKFFANVDVLAKLKEGKAKVDNFTVVNGGETIDIKGTIIKIFNTKHETTVLTNAYEGYTKDLTSFVYGTDFYSFDDLPQGRYDYVFVEANHDENYKEILKERNGGEDVPPWIFHSTDRHTTKQAALEYFTKHRSSTKAVFEPLHKSSRFYDLNN